MSNTYQNDPETKRTVDDFQRMLRQKSRQEREALLKQARDEALAEELEEERELNEREAEALRETLTQTNSREQAIFARDQARSAALLLLMLFLILWLIAAAMGRSDILRFPGAPPPPTPIQPRLSSAGDQASVGVASARTDSSTDMPGLGSLNQPTPQISALFVDYYNQNGGERIFGRPISPELTDNNRKYQWFERGRLEQWPEFAGTPYAVQGGLVGREFTKGVSFPNQTFFVSTPDVRYFPETGHGVAGRFLQFWYDAGGLPILGYPISDQVQEVLPDKQVHTVQYFERGRIEQHPENAPPQDMQLGLLGRALFLNDARPNIITPQRPTEVPLPAAVR